MRSQRLMFCKQVKLKRGRGKDCKAEAQERKNGTRVPFVFSAQAVCAASLAECRISMEGVSTSSKRGSVCGMPPVISKLHNSMQA